MADNASSEGGPSAEAVARAIFAGLNARDLDAVGELQHDDVVDDFVALEPAVGKAAVREFFVGLFAAFPDFTLTIEQVHAGDDHATVQWRGCGTFNGAPYQGVKANGKVVELRGVDVMVIRAGKLAHNTIYYDAAAFARAIGLLPPVGSIGEKALVTAFNALTTAKQTVGLG